MTEKLFFQKWQKCVYQRFKEQRLYCTLKEEWCSSKDCKEQMI
jgi:hypothetical protein